MKNLNFSNNRCQLETIIADNQQKNDKLREIFAIITTMLQSASDLLETYSTLSLVATPKKQLNSRIRQSNTPKLVKICQSGKNFVNFQRKESILISDIASTYLIFLGGWCCL